MSTKLIQWRSQFHQFYTTNSSIFKTKFDAVQNQLNSITMPDRLKGTIVEKWALYWRSLCRDYRDVIVDVGKHIKEKPVRSSIYGALGASAIYLYKHNPSETDFIEQLRLHNANIILVDQSCHNLISSQYLIFLERCYNEKIVRRLSLGIFSLLWLDDYDRAIGLYKATCKYTKPDYLTWHKRIIDMGFMDKWWKIDEYMHDYDVNEENL